MLTAMEEKCYDEFLQEMTLYVRASYEKATGKVLGEDETYELNDLLDTFFETKFENSSLTIKVYPGVLNRAGWGGLL